MHAIDLTGAVLVDFQLVSCEVGHARFDSAIFEGDTSFAGTRFFEEVSFRTAVFRGRAEFMEARFEKPRLRIDDHLLGPAVFGGTVFEGFTYIEHVKGLSPGDFDGATFAVSRPDVATP
ncbi:pentapeptide repeat-containing protein [Actinocrispum sp. NPDC049592]|uniref:pentapeptide repeat-containing protein n=1 Tax=Actinocrispum sp. NPDC049592 TaxID=3154835 RepID=UPI0034348C50